jgi:hypothetical protein
VGARQRVGGIRRRGTRASTETGSGVGRLPNSANSASTARAMISRIRLLLVVAARLARRDVLHPSIAVRGVAVSRPRGSGTAYAVRTRSAPMPTDDPGPIKPHGHARGWAAWPADVRPTLRVWNWLGLLRFERIGVPFRCGGCGEMVATNPGGDAVIVVGHRCDDCLVALARRTPPAALVTG